MNERRFWIAVIVVFVVAFAYELLLHGLFLSDLYKPYTPGTEYNAYAVYNPMLFQPASGSGRSHLWAFYLAKHVAQFLFALFFTYIFIRGVEGKGWLAEGFRYGVMVWGLAILPSNVGMYSWSQFPPGILMRWIIYGLIECVILGWVCAALYKEDLAGNNKKG